MSKPERIIQGKRSGKTADLIQDLINKNIELEKENNQLKQQYEKGYLDGWDACKDYYKTSLTLLIAEMSEPYDRNEDEMTRFSRVVEEELEIEKLYR